MEVELSAIGASDQRRIVEHLPLVRIIAAKLYRARWNDTVAFEEYRQMGAVGLVEASARFDPSRGVPFGAFASWRIAGAILNGLESATEQHQQVAARKLLLKERVDSLTSRAEGVVGSIDDSLEATLARIAAAAIGLAVGFMLEGTGMYSAGDEETPTDGYARLASRRLSLQLRAAVGRLPAQERRVLEEHYFQHRPFVDIAAAMALTRGRISQIHRCATERLRESLGALGSNGFEA